MVSMLNRMLLRDLVHLRGQVIAAALVVACGTGALVATRDTYHSLVVAQLDYHNRYRFAGVFARLKRAPESLAHAHPAALSGPRHRAPRSSCASVPS